MRRSNRNMEAFSLSALDLFVSALGAFILIAISLFPHYLRGKEMQEELTRARVLLSSTQEELEESKVNLEEKQSELDEARVELAKTFLIVGIDWSLNGADVDLYITDPEGNEFSFARNNRRQTDFPDMLAQLSYDATSGPGIEIWQNPEAKPGSYRVRYRLYSRPAGERVPVTGQVFGRRGRIDLRPVTLSGPGESVDVATISVNSEGDVSVQQ